LIRGAGTVCDGAFIRDTVAEILKPFAGLISNTAKHDHLGDELLKIRDAFRRLDVDSDQDNKWDDIAAGMSGFAAKAQPD
jgi:hypothetical protein